MCHATKTDKRAQNGTSYKLLQNVISSLRSLWRTPSACILPLVYVGTSRITVKGHVRQFTRSTHTFALEWVQEVPTHLAIVSRRSRRVVHTPHVIGRALEEEDKAKIKKN